MSEKTAFVKAQVEETKGVMVGNIEKILERGERLDDLDVKTRELSETSSNFYRSGRSWKWQMVRENMCLTIVIAMLLLIALGVSVFILYEIIRHF